MKILHVIPNLRKGGAERIALDICSELSKKTEHEVKLVSFSDENTFDFLTSNIDHQIIPSYFIPSIKGSHQFNVHDLQNFVSQYNPDITHFHLFESIMVGSTLKYNAKTKFVIHFHDNMPQFKKLSIKTLLNKQLLTNYYERKLVLSHFTSINTKFISISKDTTKFIHTNINSQYKTVLLHNAIDCKRFNNNNSINPSNRIVMIGSFVPKKGQNLAIETIAELKKRNIEVYLDLLGDGPLRIELQDLASSLDVSNNIVFHRNVNFPESFLHKAFCYLHTAKYEPFGLVILEAMAASLPVVCSDGMGNRDIIINNENGFMIDKRNPKLLADKIELLLNNNNLKNKIGKKAKEFSQQFDISTYVEKLLSVYKESISSVN